MSELERLQTWMMEVLRHPGGVKHGLRCEAAAALDPQSAKDAEHTITASRRMSAVQRLEVYSQLISGAAQGALTRLYPGVQAAMGPTAFLGLIREHSLRRPSNQGLLQCWGLDFARTLLECLDDPVEEAVVSLGSLPPPRAFLVELAELESSLHQLQWAPHVRPLDPERVRALPVERLLSGRFRFVPAMELRRLQFPACSFLERVRRDSRGGSPRLESLPTPALRLEPGGQWALISRANWQRVCLHLEPLAGELLHALIRGQRLGEALDCLLERRSVDSDRLMQRLGPWFESWGSARIFSAFEEAVVD